MEWSAGRAQSWEGRRIGWARGSRNEAALGGVGELREAGGREATEEAHTYASAGRKQSRQPRRRRRPSGPTRHPIRNRLVLHPRSAARRRAARVSQLLFHLLLSISLHSELSSSRNFRSRARTKARRAEKKAMTRGDRSPRHRRLRAFRRTDSSARTSTTSLRRSKKLAKA